MGYRSALIHEAHACFRGRWFIVSLIATLGFAIAAGIECVARASYWHNLDPFYLTRCLPRL